MGSSYFVHYGRRYAGIFMQLDGFIDQIGKCLRAGAEPDAVDDKSSKMRNNISNKVNSVWFKMVATLREWWRGGTGEALPDSVDKYDRIFAGWLMRFDSLHLSTGLELQLWKRQVHQPTDLYLSLIVDSVGSNTFQS